ncbi:MAG: acyltransferase [Bacteroidales bacterium]|nr:acyltransferase [Bacteroidales bacterium]
MITKVQKITEHNREKVYSKIFSHELATEFDLLAMYLFRVHFQYNPVYRKFCDILKINPDQINNASQIPFMPVNTFRKHKVLLEYVDTSDFFESSGTSGSEQGKHFIYDFELYERSFFTGFRHFYGNPEDFVIMALLPAYLERPHSSLVHMAKKLIEKSADSLSAFYLYDHEKLNENLRKAAAQNKKIILLGVSFALLDFSAKFSTDYPGLTIMETGGMKGRREELTREELHSELKKAFPSSEIHSEYGMTELLSQAYSKENGIFRAPPWMRIFLRDISDPLTAPANRSRGAVNIIDLANIWSCPFLATDDMGIIHADGSFEILGRLDYSVMRGCNTMID